MKKIRDGGRMLTRALALACLCAAAPLAPEALAQDKVTMADMDLLTGLSESGRWYGFGVPGRHFLTNAEAETSIYSYFFGPTTARRTFRADLEILGRTDTSSIGLYCCEQEDDSKYGALLLEPDGGVALWEVDPATGESNRLQYYPDAVADPGHAVLSITETDHGMVMMVDGVEIDTYNDPAVGPGSGGLYVWGMGAYAINNFQLTYDNSQPPDTSPITSLFGKAIALGARTFEAVSLGR